MITKETLRELVLEAESLVLQKINNDQTTKTEYFFNEIVHAKQQHHHHQHFHRKQEQKKLMEKSQKDTAKINRVQVSCQFS